jgi:hypothetical protein
MCNRMLKYNIMEPIFYSETWIICNGLHNVISQKVALFNAGFDQTIACISRVTRIGELRTLVVTSNRSKLRRSVLLLLVTANILPSSQFLVTLIMAALRFSETSVLTRATRCNMLEDGILLNGTDLWIAIKLFFAITGIRDWWSMHYYSLQIPERPLFQQELQEAAETTLNFCVVTSGVTVDNGEG